MPQVYPRFTFVRRGGINGRNALLKQCVAAFFVPVPEGWFCTDPQAMDGRLEGWKKSDCRMAEKWRKKWEFGQILVKNYVKKWQFETLYITKKA